MALFDMPDDSACIDRRALIDFCSAVLQTYGLSAAAAECSANVLVAADARGIPSHGVARLPRYVAGIEDGTIVADAEPEVVHETPLSQALDGHGAMGQVAAEQAMTAAIDRAGQHGAGFATVANSNHFGIAGWYAMQALGHDMIGIAMTNTAALGVPSFSTQAMFGTNPLAFAAPAEQEQAFVLDMSTTAVTRGKLEFHARQGRPLPEGWAVDHHGQPGIDAAQVIADMDQRLGGGLLPLGGAGEGFGGHKGFGLAAMVDILCGPLSGHGFGKQLRDNPVSAGRVGHFFCAFRIDLFRSSERFRRDMDRLLGELRRAPAATGQSRVYYAGLREFEAEASAATQGVTLEAGVAATLAMLGQQQGIAWPQAS